MDKQQLLEEIRRAVSEAPGNRIAAEFLPPGAEADAMIYDAPLIGTGDAQDPLFITYKKADVIGPWHKTPEEWLAGAKTLIRERRTAVSGDL